MTGTRALCLGAALVLLLAPSSVGAQDAEVPPEDASPSSDEPSGDATPPDAGEDRVEAPGEPGEDPQTTADEAPEPAEPATAEGEPVSEEAPSEPPAESWAGTPQTDEPAPGDDVLAADAEREVPDYSGRGEPPADPADGILWVPRILFGPIYLISEYVIRQPIGWLVSEIERTNLFGEIFDAFTWDERSAGLVPTVFFDFGFLPSVGLYFFWNDFVADGNDLRIVAGTWGPDWLHARVLDRVRFDAQNELSFYFEATRRPDLIWHGGRWDVQQNQRARFGRSWIGGGAMFQNKPWRGSLIRYRADLFYNEFDDSSFNNSDPEQFGIEEAIARGYFNAPPGYTNGYFAVTQRLDLALDTREERPASGTGIRAQAWFGHGVDLQRGDDVTWLRYGGQLGLFLDVGDQRVLQLTGYADLADTLGSEDVPFTEQVWLSQEPHLMGGFLPGQLVGTSAAVLSLEYRYPIWVFIEGSLHVSIGNVFGRRFTDFDSLDQLRMSFGFGFATIGDRDNSARILLAFGTSPFNDANGFEVTSIRFVVGSQSGF